MCATISPQHAGKKTGKLVESISLDVHINNRRFAVVCVYKPPTVDNAVFTSELTALLDEAMVSCDTVICLGDQNCDILHPDDGKKEGRCLLDICDMYDLDSIINEPTRISATKESCLDVILTNAPAFVRKSGVIETGLSDHSFVYAILNSKILHPKPETAVKRSLKHFD